MGVATVVNLMPFTLAESKPGLYPGNYLIPAAPKDDISVYHVEDAHFFVYLDENRGSMKVPVPAERVAQSIVEDFRAAKIFVVPGEAEPGLFFLPGKLSVQDIKSKFSERLSEYRAIQKKWFEMLVAQADDDWSRYRQHRMISDTQRFAAKTLGLEREWNITTIVENISKCPACTMNVPSSAVVCSSCQCILKPEEYKKLQFAKG